MKRLHLSKETLKALSASEVHSVEGGTGYLMGASVVCVNRITQNPFVCYLVPVGPAAVGNGVLDGPRPNPW